MSSFGAPRRDAPGAEDVGDGHSLSIVVPMFNEEQSAAWVLGEIVALYPGAEVIAVDDGSSDGTWAAIGSIRGVCGLRLQRRSGQSAAIYAGLHEASRPVCVLVDGDGQNDPVDIRKLVASLRHADVACGYRTVRCDTLSKRLAARVANLIRRRLLGDGIRDTGCSLKAFPRHAVAELVPFDGLHRYLPALFKCSGLTLVEVAVGHRPRRFGASKYNNLSRAVRGIYDLVGVSWLLRRRIRFPTIEKQHE